jgi:hypothetical protein
MQTHDHEVTSYMARLLAAGRSSFRFAEEAGGGPQRLPPQPPRKGVVRGTRRRQRRRRRREEEKGGRRGRTFLVVKGWSVFKNVAAILHQLIDPGAILNRSSLQNF